MSDARYTLVAAKASDMLLSALGVVSLSHTVQNFGALPTWWSPGALRGFAVTSKSSLLKHSR